MTKIANEEKASNSLSQGLAAYVLAGFMIAILAASIEAMYAHTDEKEPKE